MPPYNDEEEFEDDDAEFSLDEDDDDGDEEEGDEEAGGDEELDSLIERTDELAQEGEYRKAVKLWRQNMDRFSEFPRAYYHHALACFRYLEAEISIHSMWESDAKLIGLHEEAATALEESVELDDEQIDAWNLLGALHALREDHRSAAICWERSLELSPNQKQVKSDLAAAKAKLGDEDE